MNVDRTQRLNGTSSSEFSIYTTFNCSEVFKTAPKRWSFIVRYFGGEGQTTGTQYSSSSLSFIEDKRSSVIKKLHASGLTICNCQTSKHRKY